MTVDEVAEVLNGGLDGEPLRAFLSRCSDLEEEDSDGLRFLFSEANGVEAQEGPNGTTIQFFVLPNGTSSAGYSAYQGELPFDLHRAQDRAAVRAAMPGEPKTEGKRHDAWYLPGFKLIVNYGRTGRVETVGVTTVGMST